jgi:CheY-like chemotaxis protein
LALHHHSGFIFDCREPSRRTRVEAWAQRAARAAPGISDYAQINAGGGLMAVILIVEDEMFIRQAAEWTIEDLGHDTLLASDLSEALLHLTTGRPIDALFVDIRLSALAFGGYEVANQAVGLRPGLRVLYTSGSPLTAIMEGSFVGGGQFLQKPYSPAQLGLSVEHLLH